MEYILTLYQMRESREPVKSVHLSEKNGVNPPTVQAMFERMKCEGG